MEEVTLEKERTLMADERTLLAYIRTSLNIFIFGFVVHRLYLDSPTAEIILYFSLFFGIALLLVGAFRFFLFARGAKFSKNIKKFKFNI